MALLASAVITDLEDQIGSLDSTQEAVLLKFIQRATDELYQFQRWTWRRVTSQFTTQTPYTTGTVTATAGSTSVTGAGGAAWTGITDYDTGQFYIELNDELHHVASIDSDTGITLTAGVDTAVSGATYGIYRNEVVLDSTLAELTYVGTEGYKRLEIASPGRLHELFNVTQTQSYATHAALGPLSSKVRTVELWPFPSERRMYHYEGYMDAPTLLTTTDLGCPDNFRDVVEELTLARWFRRRDVNHERAGACSAEARRLLKRLGDDDTPEYEPIPPPSAFAGRKRTFDFRAPITYSET